MTTASQQIPDIIELCKFGTFKMWHPTQITIAKADAVTITSDLTNDWREPYQGGVATETKEFSVRDFKGIENWGMLITQLFWGGTSRPDKTYYEVWTHTKLDEDQFNTGYNCGGFVGTAILENYNPIDPFREKAVFKFWNGSSPAEDIWIDFGIGYYIFPMSNYNSIMTALSLKQYFESELAKKDEMIALLGGNGGIEEAPWNRVVRLLEEIAGHWVSIDKELKELLVQTGVHVEEGEG